MKVICKHYKICPVKEDCNHAKEHDLINTVSHKGIGSCNVVDYETHLELCDCQSKYLRKSKLKKISKNEQ